MDGSISLNGRNRLRDRRMHRTSLVKWNGVEMLLCAGFERDGSVREIFIDRERRVGSDTEMALKDACIMASMLLQHGYRCTDLLAKLMRARPDKAADAFRTEATGIAKPSFVAALLAEALELEKEHGGKIADFYRGIVRVETP